jgi:hypothetical protein
MVHNVRRRIVVKRNQAGTVVADRKIQCGNQRAAGVDLHRAIYGQSFCAIQFPG